MKKKQKYHIEDWAGNLCFAGRTFNDFEDAWGFIYQTFDHLNEDDFNEQMGEFEVMEVKS